MWTPIRRASSTIEPTGAPSTATAPADGRASPTTAFNAVVFPHRSDRKPVTAPGLTVNVRSSTTVRRPLLGRPSTLIAGLTSICEVMPPSLGRPVLPGIHPQSKPDLRPQHDLATYR